MKKRKEIITKSAAETRKLGRKVARSILNPVRDYRAGEKIQNKYISNGVKMKNNKKAVVLALKGDLGAGKTTLLQGFAKGLGIKDKILSPTFVIMKKFSRNAGSRSGHVSRRRPASPAKRGAQKAAHSKFQWFYHIDCYRIKNSKEIFELGFKEIISNPKNIIAIEWPERIGKILPKNNLVVSLKFIDDKTRRMVIAEQAYGR